MKLLPIYKLFAGGLPEFTRPFQDNEALFKQAQAFWNKLESVSPFILLIFVVMGIGLAIYYYQPYNNKPGRRYHPRHWLYFLLYTFFLTLIITLSFEYIAVAPKINGSFILELKIALGNAVYATLLYFITSVVWCNTAPTNAYRIFKRNEQA